MKTILAAAALTAALATFPAAAADFTKGNIKIATPWTRATPGGAKVAGGFVTITNAGKEPDRLIGGTVPFAGVVEVHEMKMDNNIMRMRMLPKGLEIPPGATVELKPGSYHIMFMQLKTPLQEGQRVKGSLTFEKAGNIEIEYGVAKLGASSPGGKPSGGMHHNMKH